jgi:hypothetical protein
MAARKALRQERMKKFAIWLKGKKQQQQQKDQAHRRRHRRALIRQRTQPTPFLENDLR